jgi:hypothetical protein
LADHAVDQIGGIVVSYGDSQLIPWSWHEAEISKALSDVCCWHRMDQPAARGNVCSPG